MQFKFPFFAVTFFLLVIPILLHFFGNRTYRKILISSVELLSKIKFETRSQRTIKDLLILSARLLVLLFLVLAFIQPFLEDVSQKKSAKGIKHLFLDRSSSVCESKSKSEYLGDIQKIASLNSDYSLSYGLDLNSLNNECDVYAKKLSQVISDYKDNNQISELFVISDFQKNFVDLTSISSQPQITLVNIGSQHIPQNNVAIDSVWFSEVFLKQNVPTEIHVKLKCKGREGNPSTLVEVKSGNRSIVSRSVELKPSSFAELIFPITFRKESDKYLEVRIDDHAWFFDNKYTLVANIHTRINVSIISNGKTNDPFKIAFDQDSIFECKAFSEFNRSQSDLSNSDLIVINTDDELTDPVIKQVLDYVKEGKEVVLVPRRDWPEKVFNSINERIGGQYLTRQPEFLENVTLGLPDINHPFFKGVFEIRPSVTNMPFVIPFCQFNNQTETIILSESGRSLVASFDLGLGKLTVLAFSLGINETFTRSAFFLPWVYRLAERSSYKMASPYHHVNQRVMVVPSKPNNTNQIYELQHESIVIVPKQKRKSGDVYLLLPEKNISLGLWKVRTKEGIIINEFGMNYDKNESNAFFYSTEELKRIFFKEGNVRIIDYNQFQDITDSNYTHNGWDIWNYFAMMSLVFMVCEILIIRLLRHGVRIKT